MGSAMSLLSEHSDILKPFANPASRFSLIFIGEVTMNLETVTPGRDDGHGLAQSRPAVDVAAPVHPEEKRT